MFTGKINGGFLVPIAIRRKLSLQLLGWPLIKSILRVDACHAAGQESVRYLYSCESSRLYSLYARAISS